MEPWGCIEQCTASVFQWYCLYLKNHTLKYVRTNVLCTLVQQSILDWIGGAAVAPAFKRWMDPEKQVFSCLIIANSAFRRCSAAWTFVWLQKPTALNIGLSNFAVVITVMVISGDKHSVSRLRRWVHSWRDSSYWVCFFANGVMQRADKLNKFGNWPPLLLWQFSDGHKKGVRLACIALTRSLGFKSCIGPHRTPSYVWHCWEDPCGIGPGICNWWHPAWITRTCGVLSLFLLLIMRRCCVPYLLNLPFFWTPL